MNYNIHIDKNKIIHMPEDLRNKKKFIVYDNNDNLIFESMYGMIVFISDTNILK